MKTTGTLALSALLLNSLAAAYPSKGYAHDHLHKKRNLVVVTENVYETVYSTTTLWVDPTSAAGGQFYEQPAETSDAATTSSTAAAYVAPSSSSVYVAPSSAVSSSTPTPSSISVYVAASSSSVTPSSSTVASSTAAASSASATAASSSSSGSTYSGDVTYYNPSGGYGACGFTIADSDPVVAIAHDTWDSKGTESNGNPWCGTKITIKNKDTGKTFSAKIGDKCMGSVDLPCTGGNLDLTQGLFESAFPEVNGRGKGVMEWWVSS